MKCPVKCRYAFTDKRQIKSHIQAIHKGKEITITNTEVPVPYYEDTEVQELSYAEHFSNFWTKQTCANIT